MESISMASQSAQDAIEADKLLAELDAQAQLNPSVYTYPPTALSETEADAQTVAVLTTELDALIYIHSGGQVSR